MRKEEQQFLEWLDNTSRDALCRNVKRTDTLSMEKKFRNLVSCMVNSYSFSRSEMLDAVLFDKNRTSAFKVLAFHWILVQAERYKINYYDARDRHSVEVCKKITNLSGWQELYKENVKQEKKRKNSLEQEYELRPVTSYGRCLIDMLYDMHPTNRQTFSGFVLSFFMQCRGLEKFQSTILEYDILQDTDVRFIMV